LLVSAAFVPIFWTQQRLSKSSSAAVHEDDNDDDGNWKSTSDCTIIFPAARAWRVGEKIGAGI